MTERDPFETARQELLALREENKTLKQERDHAVQLNVTMAAEIDSLKRTRDEQMAKIAARETTILMLQAFSTKFTTLIDAGVVMLEKARSEAMQQAARLGLDPNSRATEEEESVGKVLDRVKPAHED